MAAERGLMEEYSDLKVSEEVIIARGNCKGELDCIVRSVRSVQIIFSHWLHPLTSTLPLTSSLRRRSRRRQREVALPALRVDCYNAHPMRFFECYHGSQSTANFSTLKFGCDPDDYEKSPLHLYAVNLQILFLQE